MFKRHNQLFTALRVLLDMLLVAAAFWGAYALRFGSPRTWPYPQLPLPQETLAVAILALVVWPLSLRAMGLYRPQRQKTPLDEVFGVFKATLVAGLLLCRALRGRPVSEAVAVMPRFPQVMRNLPRDGRGPLPDALLEAVQQVNAELDDRGRVLVRPSGTEPVVRVLAEAETAEAAEDLCAKVAALVTHELG